MKLAGNPQATVPWRLLDGYQPVEGAYDEMVASPDVLRPQSEAFVRSLESLGRHELASRWDSAKRTLRDNGVTYNVYGDPQGTDRPWELDMVPLVVTPDEWSRLEAALMQRTELLNLVGRAQVEVASAAVAVRQVHEDAPVRQILVHADHALRTLARAVLQNGRALEEAKGLSLDERSSIHAGSVHAFRAALSALQGVRMWAFAEIAGGVGP